MPGEDSVARVDPGTSAKPNAELILGYGFALDENPEDTIVLRIGGGPAGGGPAASRRWEVGRDAQGAEGVYAEVLSRVRSGTSPDEDPGEDGWDAELDAAEMLEDMVGAYLERLPQVGSAHGEAMRPDVQAMLTVYVEGARVELPEPLNVRSDRFLPRSTSNSGVDPRFFGGETTACNREGACGRGGNCPRGRR